MKLLLLLVVIIGSLAQLDPDGTLDRLHRDVVEREKIEKELQGMNLTWTAKFSRDFENYDHMRTLCGSLPGGAQLPEEQHFDPELVVPEAFDSRTQWGKMCPSLLELRDQSACGSCWAMGGIAAATDRVCIQSNGTVKDRLSAEDLVGCCHTCGMGCNGGYPSAVWNWFKNHGVVTGGAYQEYDWCSSYSLKKCDHHCTGKYGPCPTKEYPTPRCPIKCDAESTYTVAFGKDTHVFQTAHSVRGVENIQKDIMTNGPGEVSFTVYADFEAYTGGVYEHKSGSQLGGHAVKFVGWGVDAGTPYWIVANSWNEDWGEKGFFRIIRGKNECGIEASYVTGMYKN